MKLYFTNKTTSLSRTLGVVVFVLDVSTVDLEIIFKGAHNVYHRRQQHGLSAEGDFALSTSELGIKAGDCILLLTSAVP